ncbi:unnamed protein product [Symbiodinium sp. CCMP2456]|nr:unnamed protein product [Symbiodinium sp. CCMP2456]
MFLLAHAGLTACAMCQVGLKFWEFPGRNPMTWTPVLFLLTLLEHMDMFTDALFVGTAAACSDTIADQFEKSWAAVGRGGLGPLMAKLTFGGLAFSFVLAAYLPQLVYLPSPAVPLFLPAAGLLLGALAIGYSSWAVGVAMALPLTVAAINFGERMWRGNFTRQLEDRKEGALWVGMVVFQNFHYIVGDEVPKSVRLVAFGLVRLLYENLLQLWLQSSYFAFTFEATGDTAKAKILVSLALGLGVSVSKLPEMFSAWYDEMRLPADCRITVYETLRRCGEPRRDNICPCVSVLLFCLVALGPVLAVAAKVYFAYACPDHVWNILGGCVVLD